MDLKARLECSFSIGDVVTNGPMGNTIGKISGLSFDDSNHEQVMRITVNEGQIDEYSMLIRQRWFEQLERI